MDYSIAIILPNSLVIDTAQKILDEMKLDYPICRASENQAVEIAHSLIKKGTQIFISAGHTYTYLRENLSTPVMELPFSGLEAAVAIKHALTISDRIVHIGTPSLFHYIKKSMEFLNVDISCVRFYELNMGRSVKEQTMDMIEEGYEVFIGGYAVTKLAKQYGKIGIEVNVDELIIKSTLTDAQALIAKILENQNENELKSAILQASNDGIIAIDTNRNIFMFNNAAERIIGSDLQSRNIEDVMQENNIIDVDSLSVDAIDPNTVYTPVILNEAPIDLDNYQKGSVITIKTMEQFQELQYKTRKDLYVQGLWAEYTFNSIKGTSEAINLAKEKAQIYAQYNSPVLISGETGTGKEVFAQSIHNASRRKVCPWVPVNCASLPENLIESELFGYVKGAFTGANKEGKKGFFELADGGTIFLDEISELPITIQSKLLRVIQEGDVIRVGSNKITHVDVRIICSSNKDLLQLIKEKKFKEDLYYRLNVLEINLPPLRERREDIEALAYTFLKKFNKQHEKNITSFSAEALDMLRNLPLLGNVRELSNIVERMVIFTTGNTITKNILMDTVNIKMPSYVAESEDTVAETPSAPSNLKDAQKEMIISVLEKNNGNKAATARELGIDPSTLWRRLKKYGLN